MKLHLGCGRRHIPGFVHIDVVDFPHIDHQCSVDSLPFLPSGSVDLVYNCHVLEHFKRREVPRVLREWHRVLRPGGVLRTSVPDFAQMCEIYRESSDLGLVIGLLFGRQDYLYNFHYSVFDEATLSEVLLEVGFAEVRRYDWRETGHADIDDYAQAYIPHMDKESGRLMSLNLEAVK